MCAGNVTRADNMMCVDNMMCEDNARVASANLSVSTSHGTAVTHPPPPYREHPSASVAWPKTTSAPTVECHLCSAHTVVGTMTPLYMHAGISPLGSRIVSPPMQRSQMTGAEKAWLLHLMHRAV